MRARVNLIAMTCLVWVGFAVAADPLREQPEPPQTVAESSDYRATATYEDVVSFAEALAGQSESVTLGELGTTSEGRSIPLLIVADPPIADADAARAGGKLRVLLIGNIHAGEVCGKEALLMLARELGLAEHDPLLKNLIVAIVPIYNADGNERFSPDNRPGQVGPERGMGVRHNAQDLDLNRDYVKMEAPETRALARFMRDWDPSVIVDTHTTDGSHHRYTLTYAGPKNPAGDAAVLEFVRDRMLPAISQTLRESKGWDTFFYGNFDREKTSWSTYPAMPRYGTPYRGLRNRVAILSEAYAYASYKDRVLATRDFCRAILDYAADNRQRIETLIAQADERTTKAGQTPSPEDLVPIRSRLTAFDKKVTVKGYVEEEQDGKLVATDEPKDYRVEHRMRFEPTLSVRRPWAYLVPGRFSDAIQNLKRHGISLDELREDIELDVETYRIDSVDRAERVFEKHALVRVEATPLPGTVRVPAGTIVVRTAQPLGSLIVTLMEPEAEDGLTTWNFFDDGLGAGERFPVLRVLDPIALTTTPAVALDEDRTFDKPMTFETLYGKDKAPNFSGSPVRGLRWIDAEHFLQSKDGSLLKVEAATGRAEAFLDTDAIASALSALATIDDKAARRIARRAWSNMNADRSAFIFTHENDLYLCRTDGSEAVRLTSTPEREEVATFSPDGRFVAFVANFDLWVVDIATQTSRRLTTGGTDQVRHAKADWVYYEEVFGRNWKAYWWSPDSMRIALLETDSTPIQPWTLVNDAVDRQAIERARYPKPGEENPRIRIGLVSVAGGPVRWADLSDYDEGGFIVMNVGWWPDSSRIWSYIQNRTQTWLDLGTIARAGGKPKRLLRETTEAWVDAPPPPRFLKDQSFLLLSERDGWRHIYHYNADGSLRRRVTAGPWEVRSIEHVDEDAGVVLLTGTRDSHTAINLYRTPLDGDAKTDPPDPIRLTNEDGSHRVSVSPDGAMFIDTWSTPERPSRVVLRSGEGGATIRTLDTNPVYAIQEYRHAPIERFRVPTRDGFDMEVSTLKPPDFDAAHRYPAWFMTYGGPHTPTVYDAWSRSWAWDQMLAQMGIVVFRGDPRSASGKGAVSAWTCYRQLGVQEMADIEDLIGWLRAQDYVDPDRIGMSGHSYGGFMTSYAMTHSDLFSAGIAGAPVTDWRDYDTIYTERFMSTPQDNPDGYATTSVVKAAKNLHGRLMLLHGTMDDNVHMQNSIKFIAALQKANKRFDLMIYPGSRHGLYGKHYRTQVYQFIRETMLGAPGKPRQMPTPRPSPSESEPEPAGVAGPAPR